MLLEILSTNRSSSCLTFSRWEFDSFEHLKKVLELESTFCSRGNLKKALVIFLNTKSGWGNGTEGIYDFKLIGKNKVFDWKGYKVVDSDLDVILDSDWGESFFESVAQDFFASPFWVNNAASKLRNSVSIIKVAL